MIVVDTDGILLEETFSPILYRLSQKYHKTYSQELEGNTLSQNRQEVAIFEILLYKKQFVFNLTRTESFILFLFKKFRILQKILDIVFSLC